MPHSVDTTPAGAGDAESAIRQARQALEAGRFEAAERLFLALTGTSSAADAHKGIGDVLLRQGRLGRAAEAYRAALQLRPGWPEAENNLGNVWKLQGDKEKAEEHYRRALSQNPLLAAAGNNLGVLLAEKGQIDEAVARFRAALLGPSPVREARRNLATALFQLGRIEEARAEFEGALAENPEDPDTLAGMARLLHATGKAEEALRLACEALKQRPGFGAAYLEAGAAALALGDAQTALPYCRQAVETAPNNAEAHEALGCALLALGMPQDGEHHLQRALALAPKLPLALIELGKLYEEQDRLGEAEEKYQAALAADPENALAMTHLGNLAFNRKKPAEALQYFERARKLRPGVAAAQNNLARTLHELGRHQEAAEAFRKAIALNPHRAEPHQNLGAILQTLGRFDEARASFERALELDPDLAQAIYALSSLAPGASREALLPRIERLLAKDKLAEETKAQLYFAKVRLCEHRGDHDAAFAAAVAGNAIEARRESYDAVRFERLAAGIKETFVPEFFARRRSYGSVADSPIFIVGVPRSGTTLIEQVLASHSRVFGGGELPFLPQLADDLPRWGRARRTFPHGLADLHEPEVLRLAGAYRRYTRGLAGASFRVTDKMTSNLFYLGLAALLFPRAKIVYCRRNPFDLFISAYFTQFRTPIPFTTEQKSFAHYYLIQESLLAHWRRVLPLEIHEVEYENFVAGQEAQTRALLQYCGLDWEARCLNFHLTERPIRTSSDTQVRRPLYRSAVGRAAPYRKYLGELEAALAAPPSPSCLPFPPAVASREERESARRAESAGELP